MIGKSSAKNSEQRDRTLRLKMVGAHVNTSAHLTGCGDACGGVLQVPAEGAGRSLLEAVLGLILEADYSQGVPDQTMRNPEAAPLFFHFLRGAAEPVQAWGLDAWFRLLSGSMANLSACQRCAPPWHARSPGTCLCCLPQKSVSPSVL